MVAVIKTSKGFIMYLTKIALSYKVRCVVQLSVRQVHGTLLLSCCALQDSGQQGARTTKANHKRNPMCILFWHIFVLWDFAISYVRNVEPVFARPAKYI